MDSQPEFPLDLPRQADSVNPRLHFAEFRAGKKIIQIPYSIWKDGRMRADCSAYGGGCPVSRDARSLLYLILEILREQYDATVEAVYEQFSRLRRPKASKPRSSNKLAALPESATATVPRRHINPFVKDIWIFSKTPQWLLTRREPSLAEKLVYCSEFVDIPGLEARWGIKRSLAYQLLAGGKIRGVSLRRPGALRGKRLFSVDSIRQFLREEMEVAK